MFVFKHNEILDYDVSRALTKPYCKALESLLLCFLLALEPAKLEVFMSVHGFVKIVEICLLKLQENVKNRKQQQEAHRVSKEVLFSFRFVFFKFHFQFRYF